MWRRDCVRAVPSLKARCHVKSLPTLPQGAVHAVAVLSIGMLGLITAGCYDLPEHAPMVNAADFRPFVSLAPTPITFAPLSVFPCTGGGFVFDPSLQLVITAGVSDVTFDSVTIHMIDGSNLGGPSITVPQPELAARFGSTLIVSTSTRDFALRPDFGCVTVLPTALQTTAVVVDSGGVPQTVVLRGSVQ